MDLDGPLIGAEGTIDAAQTTVDSELLDLRDFFRDCL
jgi:hypothetical protein